jgi:uncharacterized protein
VTSEPFARAADDLPAVSGILHRAAGRDGLVLTHGAGGDAGAPLLVDLARASAAAGLTVLRCDLPYRQRRRQGPPSPATAGRDRDGLRHAVRALRDRVAGRLFLGGASYGGRQASMVAAADPGLVAALLLLSYPLHPPSRRETPRVEHFPALRTPALFVHGDRDPFGSLEELAAARALIPARTALLVVKGGHDLGYTRPAGGQRALAAEVVREFLRLVDDRDA